ncbi:hypothetical protein [Winogradskyella thalassocola]|uniref:Uncharacterized protein n=1 Tax=Winogradskyella thalassocola TaxID=262004 RepID=A0A1G7ZP17_9FLAO|nr:hypothetical protein [Winogradskyella thalassocola]SDH10512.1 hypothetical protein SAMN04489796_1011396 [Winogradskyella thalassocola]
MLTKYFYFSLLSCLILFSCISDDDTLIDLNGSLLIEKENSLTAQEKIRELLILTEGDYAQLACIFNCSPSSLKRLYESETFATPEAEKEINGHYNYFITNKNSLDDFKADCATYKWYHHVNIFMSNWWFWVIIIIICVLIAESTEGLWVVIIFLSIIIYIVALLFCVFNGEPNFAENTDNYINVMDTLWETKI